MKKEISKQIQWLRRNKKIITICANTVYIIASVALGSVLTVKAVKAAQTARGYTAIGGEWLVLLIVLMSSCIMKRFLVFLYKVIKEISKEDDDMTQIIELKSYRRKKRR